MSGTSVVFLDRAIVGIGDKDARVELDSARAKKLVDQGFATRASRVDADEPIELGTPDEHVEHVDDPQQPRQPRKAATKRVGRAPADTA